MDGTSELGVPTHDTEIFCFASHTWCFVGDAVLSKSVQGLIFTQVMVVAERLLQNAKRHSSSLIRVDVSFSHWVINVYPLITQCVFHPAVLMDAVPDRTCMPRGAGHSISTPCIFRIRDHHSAAERLVWGRWTRTAIVVGPALLVLSQVARKLEAEVSY